MKPPKRTPLTTSRDLRVQVPRLARSMQKMQGGRNLHDFPCSGWIKQALFPEKISLFDENGPPFRRKTGICGAFKSLRFTCLVRRQFGRHLGQKARLLSAVFGLISGNFARKRRPHIFRAMLRSAGAKAQSLPRKPGSGRENVGWLRWRSCCECAGASTAIGIERVERAKRSPVGASQRNCRLLSPPRPR